MFGQNDNSQDQNQAFNPALPNAPIASAPVPDTSSVTSFGSTPPTPPPTTASVNPNEFNATPSLPAEPPVSQPSVPQAGPVDNNLIGIKQQALQQLSPLVGRLEQTPEEKFRTTMMMIQASDDQSLIKTAYESAGQIVDEKARAQALLDIVNEINYFTQQSQNQNKGN